MKMNAETINVFTFTEETSKEIELGCAHQGLDSEVAFLVMEYSPNAETVEHRITQYYIAVGDESETYESTGEWI